MKKINTEKLSALLKEHAGEELRENITCGKEIAVHQIGVCVYHETFGSARAGGGPLEKNRMYRLASMTKPITAVAAAQLADRGLLDLDAPASDFYPQMKHMQVATVEKGKIVSLRPAKNVIRVKDLLSHTSGIGCSPVFEILKDSYPLLPLKDAIRKILGDPLSFEPLANVSYSMTAAFDVAAGIVEIVSGMAFDAYLKENIFGPLHMVDTTFDPNREQWDRMVAMHVRAPDGSSADEEQTPGCVGENYVPARMMAGGGLASTAEDYIRFADMLCLGGVSADGVRLLSEAMVRRLATPNAPDLPELKEQSWGLGMRVILQPTYPRGLGVGCFGWSGAYGTHFWADPENKIAVVLMKNSKYPCEEERSSISTLELDVSAALK